MKLLTKNTDYAIRALFVLAKNKDGYLSVRDIAKQQKIPYEYLRKILRVLIKEKLVESKKGGGGGFHIKTKPENVSIIDVIKVFQGDIELSDCMFRNRICENRKSCVLRKNIKRIEKVVEKEFKGITIAGLLTDMEKGRN